MVNLVMTDVISDSGSGVVVGISVNNAVEGEAVIDKAILVNLQRKYGFQGYHNIQREKNEKLSMFVRICR